MMFHRRFFFLALALLLLLGADECPISTQSGGAPGASGEAALDVGGASGAAWDLTFEAQAQVTVQTRTGQETKSVTLGSGQVLFAADVIDLDSFCWRADTLCPDRVLPSPTLLVQSASYPGKVVVGFTRQGPLASLRQEAGILGQLQGQELQVPLAVGNAAEGICGLQEGSGIQGMFYLNDQLRADTLLGRVVVRYSGACFTSGGGGTLENDALVEVSMPFRAKRR
jgi:hypothetical protein